ncbi:hypothetical protein EDB19DRAFT_972792 [Suillus lakei]|nr:hypothetical protein EDB19DRAFT_972792 [Suillus lakei]
MDSIKTHYAALRGPPSNAEPAYILGKRKSTTGPIPITGKTRKSSVVVKKDRVPSTSRLHPISKKVIPGGLGDNDDDYDGEEGEDRDDDIRGSKRVHFEAVENVEKKREVKKLEGCEASHRRLDTNKAKRRSSMGRPNIGKGVVRMSDPNTSLRAKSHAIESTLLILLTDPPKQTSCFGSPFSANVSAAKPAPAPLTKMAAPSISFKPMKEPPKAQSTTKEASVVPSGAPPVPKERLPSVSNSKRMPSGISLVPVVDSTSSRTLKSSTSKFPAPGTRRMSHSRSNSASSLGIASRTNNPGSVSSMGAKTSLTGKLRGTTTGTARARTSTLMAPTASSLAKTRPHTKPFLTTSKH